MPKFSGVEQQVSSDGNGMTNISRLAPKRNMNSGAVIGHMSRPHVNPRRRSNSTLDALRSQVRKRRMGM